MTSDTGYMKMALALAEKGRGYTSPNPMVGAVVVKEGKIVGKGWHKRAGEAHAEAMAIDAAGASASGGTLYVTLEPCNHEGRTPPCTRKIIEAGIRHVVVAMEDPNPHVTGGGIECLKQHNIGVVSGVCRDAAEKMNESFIKHSLTHQPFVVLKWAATLDGRIATRTGDSKWITNERSRGYVHRLRHQADAVMVGIGTVAADDPSLTVRLDNFDGRDPSRIILDSTLKIDADARVLNRDSGAETIIIAGTRYDPRKRNLLEEKGAKIVEADDTSGRVDMRGAMKMLGAQGITSVLIEGGSRVSASALAAGVVDKVCLFYAPKILGGDDGIPVCRGSGPERINQSTMIKDTRVRLFDDDVMIEGYIDKSCLRES